MVKQKANRTEQYTMRPNLRINGVLAKKGETNEEVVAIVKEISSELGVELEEGDLFRAHRVGKIVPEKKSDGTTTGKKVQSIIVRFRSWNKRCQLYRARPKKKDQANKRVRKCPRFQSINLDLAKSTRDLLDKANNEIKINFPNTPQENEGYAFADINCNLRMRLPGADDKFVYFNNLDDLNKIFASC